VPEEGGRALTCYGPGHVHPGRDRRRPRRPHHRPPARGRGRSRPPLEASGRLGGQLHTEREGGFVVEIGAEGFVARSTAVPDLAADLGIAGELVGQTISKSYGFDGTSLVELAPGEAALFLGFQVPRDELGQGIRTFRGGMGALPEALERALHVRDSGSASGPTSRALAGRVEIHRGAPVRSIAPCDQGHRIETPAGAFDADAVVVAIPAVPAAPLLAPLAGEAARALASARTLSSVTVSLAHDREAIDHPLDATGFVVAEAHQLHGFRACTFTSSKFEGRAPADAASLRLFFRPTPADLADLDDPAWIARAEAALARVLRVKGPAKRAWVSRWADALPVVDGEHRACVAAVEAALAGRRVLLAGSAFHGSGIDAAVRSANAAVAALGSA
jgi:oxygen-dependent protoporphyrinogen oxidase